MKVKSLEYRKTLFFRLDSSSRRTGKHPRKIKQRFAIFQDIKKYGFDYD